MLAENADPRWEQDLCCVKRCSQSNETRPRPKKCSLCPKGRELNNRLTGCEILVKGFSPFWQLNTFQHMQSELRQTAVKWTVMKTILFHLRPILDSVRMMLVKHSDRSIVEFVFSRMDGGSAACISLSARTQTWLHEPTFCLICLLPLEIYIYIYIYKLISILQRPVRIYNLCKSGIPWKSNCFLNRPHDKRQATPRFQLETGGCQTLTLMASRFPMPQHTQCDCEWSHRCDRI